ncbi:MAG: agmatinase [Alphaproteobacteria bacterium]|nr:agmatinase [Alphaproteobacteria bacterium]
MAQRYTANMPMVGITSFLKSPICEEFDRIDADVAVLGIPYDAGIGFRPGTRFGPREIRNYSARYSAWGGSNPQGYWDVNQKKRLLKGVRIVDAGDVDIVYYDIDINMRKIRESTRALLDRGAFPVLIGGDHSVTYPIVQAFDRRKRLDIVQIDAHMDWLDHLEGVRYSNASPLRRCKELPFVQEMVHLGIRDIRSREENIADAEKAGAKVFTREDVRALGAAEVVRRMPPLEDVYVTIDIDGLDPSQAPGTGSPTVDGLLYHEVRALLQGVAKKGRVVGFDVVEVNPMLDHHGQTCLLATTLIMEFLGAVFEARGQR